MKRRTFIKTSLVTSVALAIAPQLAFQDTASEISYDMLIGKGNPLLYGEGYKLQKQVHEAFSRLKLAALKDNIRIQVVSSYRSFDHQNRIWKRKYRTFINNGLAPEQTIKKIIEYSTIPGTSRHHWGTDIDIIDASVKQPSAVLQPKHFETGGCYRNLKLWMDENAEAFGFFLVYTDKPNRKGFKYEPWHYSFKPVSQQYLKYYLKLNFESIMAQEQVLGYQYFSNEFISNYLNQNILDINPELL